MPKTILIVNGDADTREILRVLLRHHGYVTREAMTVDDAIAAAFVEPAALITGEFWVPASSGYCCLPERIRAEEALAETRVLVLTADAFEGVHLRAKAAGADGLMTKPFELPALIREIRRLIGPAFPPPAGAGAHEQDQLRS
jgi:CheY-like chemotaxis protein